MKQVWRCSLLLTNRMSGDFGEFDEAGALDYDEVARIVSGPNLAQYALETIEVCGGTRARICMEAKSIPRHASALEISAPYPNERYLQSMYP